MDLRWPPVALCGVGGGGYVEVGDLTDSPLPLPAKLPPVADRVDMLETVDSSDMDRLNAVGGGLANIGVRALRKSV